MTSKTKIIVLHLKELVRTGIFIGLGIIAILLLIFLFRPDREPAGSGQSSSEDKGSLSSGTQNTLSIPAQASYIPGVYSTALVLGNHAVDVEVIVDKDNIIERQIKTIGLEKEIENAILEMLKKTNYGFYQDIIRYFKIIMLLSLY